MTITQDFKEKGHFVGYVIVEGENEKFISRFPFSVGYPAGIMPSSLQMLLILFLLIIMAVIWFVRNSSVAHNKNTD